MNAPHFRSDPSVAKLFDRHVHKDPARAVHMVINAGYSIELDDVPLPHLAALTGMLREVQPEYRSRRAEEISRERAAISILGNQANLRAAAARAAKGSLTDDREKRISARALELEALDLAEKRASWREQATAEIDGTALQPTTLTTHEPVRKRRSA